MTKTNALFKDKQLYKMILSIGVPIACQNLLSFLVQMLDTIMLGEIGDIPLAASSLGGQIFFVYSLFAFGLGGGAAVLTAQYWGKREIAPIKIIVASVLRVVGVVGIVLAAIVIIFPEFVITIFSKDEEVIKQGIVYLQTVGISYAFFGLSNITVSMFRTVEKVKLAVVSTCVGLVVNAFLNWVLIFGNLGAPRLEIKGAAIATVCAKVCEFIVVMGYLFFVDKVFNFKPKDLFLHDKILSKDLLKYCTPVATNEIIWSVGIAMQAFVFGNISTDAVAANTVIGVVQNLSTIFIFGLANATAVIIGKTIGEGRMEVAQARAREIKVLAILLGFVAAGVILLCKGLFIDFYNVSPAVKELANKLIYVTAVTVFFISTSGISIVGTLRGGGDAKIALYMDIGTLWVIAIPLGALCGFVFKLPIVVVYAVFKSDELIKAILCWIRLRNNKWMKNVTRDEFDLEKQNQECT